MTFNSYDSREDLVVKLHLPYYKNRGNMNTIKAGIISREIRGWIALIGAAALLINLLGPWPRKH